MKNCLIVLNYNDYHNTENLINNVRRTLLFTEVVIVDNCSTDGSFEKLLELQTNQITVIKTDRNGGYGYGNNFGFKYLYAKYSSFNAVFCNPDVIFDATELVVMCKKLGQHVDAIGPVIKEHNYLNRGWKLPTGMQSTLQNIPGINKLGIANTTYKDDYYQSELTNVDVLSGSIFAIKSAVFADIGMFDENVFLYYEENILGKKMKNKNYHQYVDNRTCVQHLHSTSIDNSWNAQNKIRMLKESQLYFHENYCDERGITIIMLKASIGLINLLAKIRGKINR